MLTKVLNLGTVLNKNQQQKITGGSPFDDCLPFPDPETPCVYNTRTGCWECGAWTT